MRSAPSPRSTLRPRSAVAWLTRIVVFALVVVSLGTGVLAPAQAAQERGQQAPEPAKRVLPSTSVSAPFPAGTLLVDMGAAQTVATGLKPYGFVYEMLTTYKVPVTWAIANGKSAMGATDFSASNLTDLSTGAAVGSKTFAGGSFLISGLFSGDVPAAALKKWTDFGVKIYKSTASLGNLPQFTELRSWPKVVLDSTSSAVAVNTSTESARATKRKIGRNR